MKHKIFILSLVISVFLSGCRIGIDQSEEKWEELFNGKDFGRWEQKGGSAIYAVDRGQIVGTTTLTEQNSFLCTKKHYCDFILEFEFKVDEKLNSGVQFRSHSKPEYKKGRVHGYQVEIDPVRKPYTGNKKNLDKNSKPILDTKPRNWTGGIYGEGGRGWICTLHDKPAARDAFRPGKWNHIRLEAIGESIKTYVNNVPAADLKDDRIACGFIGLQVHSSEIEGLQVRWRNLRIQELGKEL